MHSVRVQPGARCSITAPGRLGAIAHPDAARFEPEVVHSGAVATYFGPHPTLDGWHFLIAVAFDPETPGPYHEGRPLFVPCTPAHFEVLA